jgi:hypothetical protein
MFLMRIHSRRPFPIKVICSANSLRSLVWVITFFLAGVAHSGQEIERIRALVNDYKEWYQHRLIEKPTVEELQDHFEVGQAVFPNTINLPAIADAKRKWTPPKYTKGKPPNFPRELIFQLPADLDIAILIDEGGNPIDTFIINSSNEKFNDSVISALRSWQFKPALLDDLPCKSVLIAPIHFGPLK